MADGFSTVQLAIPPEALKRLKEAEARQRNETKREKLPAEFVSVEGLWLIQRALCGCLECAKGKASPLNPNAVHGDPDHIVIMHIFPRGAKGGHTVANVRLGLASHNLASAHQEWADIAKGRRMAVDFSKKLLVPEERKPRGSMKSRAVSKLSKDHPGYRKPSFGTRK